MYKILITLSVSLWSVQRLALRWSRWRGQPLCGCAHEDWERVQQNGYDQIRELNFGQEGYGYGEEKGHGWLDDVLDEGQMLRRLRHHRLYWQRCQGCLNFTWILIDKFLTCLTRSNAKQPIESHWMSLWRWPRRVWLLGFAITTYPQRPSAPNELARLFLNFPE